MNVGATSQCNSRIIRRANLKAIVESVAAFVGVRSLFTTMTKLCVPLLVLVAFVCTSNPLVALTTEQLASNTTMLHFYGHVTRDDEPRGVRLHFGIPDFSKYPEWPSYMHIIRKLV